MPQKLFLFVLAALLPISLPAAAIGSEEFGETVIKQGSVKRDVYAAGATVDVLARVEGDVIAAGGQVTIDERVSGDVLVAGGNVAVRAQVGDDVRAAGGNVTLSGAIGDEAVVGGGRILIAPGATVGGRARLGGGSIHVAGSIEEGLKAAGNRIVISGRIAGDAELYAEQIDIQPGAAVGGNLIYRSGAEARIADDAKIGGKVIRHRPGPEGELREGVETAGRIARIGLYLSLIVTGIVLFLLFPLGSVGAARTINDAPWVSLGLGFAVLVATPFLVVLLLVSLFGVWLALTLLALYLVLLLLGFLTGVLYVGDWGLRLAGRAARPAKGWYVLAIVLALLALWAVRLVPVLGILVIFALLLFGLGALTLYLWGRYVAA